MATVIFGVHVAYPGELINAFEAQRAERQAAGEKSYRTYFKPSQPNRTYFIAAKGQPVLVITERKRSYVGVVSCRRTECDCPRGLQAVEMKPTPNIAFQRTPPLNAGVG